MTISEQVAVKQLTPPAEPLAELRGELADTKILRVRLFQEVADLRQQLATAQAERDAAREEVKGLNKEIVELRGRLVYLLGVIQGACHWDIDAALKERLRAALAAKGGA